MEWQHRIERYEKDTGLPKTLFVDGTGRLSGVWFLGNDYRVKSKYYGGYPAGYLKRMRALFYDKEQALHLFSGKVETRRFFLGSALM